MTSEELTVLKNDVNKLLEIYNADKPINNDGTFDTEKIKTVTSEEYIETVRGIGYRLHL